MEEDKWKSLQTQMSNPVNTVAYKIVASAFQMTARLKAKLE